MAAGGSIMAGLLFPMQATMFTVKSSSFQFIPNYLEKAESLPSLLRDEEDYLSGSEVDLYRCPRSRSNSRMNQVVLDNGEPSFVKEWKLQKADPDIVIVQPFEVEPVS